jgi:hypothetical protein
MHVVLAPTRARVTASTPVAAKGTSRSARVVAVAKRTAAIGPARRVVRLSASVSRSGDDAKVVVEAKEAVNELTAAEGASAAQGPHTQDDEMMDSTAVAATALFATFAFAFFAGADPAVAMDHSGMDLTQSHEVFQTAGGDVPFWANMVKYARFSISIMVGFAFMFGRPVVNLLKKPQTAVLVIGGAYGGFRFFKWTIETMVGMNDDMTINY